MLETFFEGGESGGGVEGGLVEVVEEAGKLGGEVMLDEGLDEGGKLGVGDGRRVFIFVGEAQSGGVGGCGDAVGLVEKVVGLLEFKVAEMNIGAEEAAFRMGGVEGEGGGEGFIGLGVAVLIFMLSGEFEVVGGYAEGGLFDVGVFLLELIEGVEGDLFTGLNGAEAKKECE